MNRVLGLTNLPKINWSSRFIISTLLLLFISLFLGWSKLSNAGTNSSQITQYGTQWIISILIFIPIISWSIFEVFRLIPHLKMRWSLMAISIGIILSPEIFLIKKAFGGNGGNDHIKKYVAALIISGLSLFIFSSFIYGNLGISDYEELRQKYAFRRLLMCAHIFWNSLFFSTWISDLSKTTILIFYVIANDSFAYLFGKTFGKKKIFKWSPQKTLEGFLLSSIFLPLIFQIVLVSIPKLKDESIPQWAYILASFLIPLIAHLGDLFFSAQKRVFGIKNYGKLLGEQGGFWDRFDSHTFALLFLSFLTITNKITNG